MLNKAQVSDCWINHLISWPYLLITITYFLTWHLLFEAATLFEVAPAVSAWFPAAGLRFALIVVLGWRLSVPILVFVWASLAPGYWDFWMSRFPFGFIVESFGNPIVHLIAVTFLVKVAKVNLRRGSLRDISWFCVGALIAPMISAIIVCSNLAAASIFEWKDVPSIILDFWVGDVIGILVITPFLVLLAGSIASKYHHKLFTNQSIEPTACDIDKISLPTAAWLTIFVVFGIVLLVLGFGKLPVPDYVKHYVFLSFLPLSWIAIRFGFYALAISVFAMNTFSIIFIHFTGFTSNHAEFQFFLVTLSLTSLVICGLATNQRRAEKKNKRYTRTVSALG